MKQMFSLFLVLFSLLFFSCDPLADGESSGNRLTSPTITVESGSYSSPFLVEITSDLVDVLIYYTLDGTNPARTSELYTEPVLIEASCTLKVLAVKEGRSSSIVSVHYSLDTSDRPSISPASGTYRANQTITLTSDVQGAIIRFTTDGSEPVSNSGVYSNPFTISNDANIRAKAFVDGEAVGETLAAYYIFQTAPVVFSVEAGLLEESQRLYLTCSSPGAIIYYSLDGSLPGTWSSRYYTPSYFSGTNITIDRAMTVRAVAVKTGWNDSAVKTQEYIMQLPEITFNLEQGRYSGAKNLTLSSGVSGSVIRYTLDGSDPNESSPIYSEAIVMGASMTVKAYATKEGWENSPLMDHDYEIAQVSILAGSGYPGWSDGQGRAANLKGPAGMAWDSDGNIVFADSDNNRICLLSPDGTVSTLTGQRTAGGINGALNVASFDKPSGIAIDSSGNIYITETGGNRIRKIDDDGQVTTVAGTGTAGLLDGPGLSAQFWQPRDLVVTSEGILYVADTRNNRVRMIDTEGVVTTLGVDTELDFGDDNNGTEYSGAKALGIDSQGNIYLSASYGIYKIQTDGTVEVLKELTDLRAQVNDIVCGPDDEIYVLNVSTYGSFYSGYYSFISELDNEGNYQKVIDFNCGNGDTEDPLDKIEIRPLYFMLLDNDGNFYASDSLVSENGNYMSTINVIRKFYWQEEE